MSAGPIMIMAGGTGGHVFPGLTVADALRERGRSVVWLGTRRGLEARVVPAHGIEIEWISVAGWRGKGAAGMLTAPLRAAVAVGQALGVMRRRKPAAVLGLGGFASGPGGLAAWLLRRPLLIHEQNAVAGTTNRWLARFAARVFEAFSGSFPAAVPAECIGNPVRRSIAALPPAAERIAALRAGEGVDSPDEALEGGSSGVGRAQPDEPVPGAAAAPTFRRRPRLLVLGGSQGARVLNTTVPAALARVRAEHRPEVRHQGGRLHEEARAAYREAGVEAEVLEFIDDVAEAYGWADFAVARAGALTISELAAAGVGAVLVPYPHAIDDHQARNAAGFAAVGAGIVLAERDLDADALADVLSRLLADPGRLEAMAAAARGQARTDAAERLADACIELAEGAR